MTLSPDKLALIDIVDLHATARTGRLVLVLVDRPASRAERKALASMTRFDFAAYTEVLTERYRPPMPEARGATTPPPPPPTVEGTS